MTTSAVLAPDGTGAGRRRDRTAVRSVATLTVTSAPFWLIATRQGPAHMQGSSRKAALIAVRLG